MPKTVADIYRLFHDRLDGWDLRDIVNPTPEERERLGLFHPADTYILVNPEGEKIVVIFCETSVTGTERTKPQIRVFMDKIKSAYKYSKIKQLRFFSFIICKTDSVTLKLPAGIVPDDYLVSLESSFDRCPSGRVDIRSMYDALEENLDKSYFRLSKGSHKCSSIEQASFIKISDNGGQEIIENLLAYLTYFDNRPYMLSTKEGVRVIYQPSALFENATGADSKYPWNMLVFGAPGTGKSRLIENKVQTLKDELGEDAVISNRITFYADYTYQQFVGGYMPVPKTDMQEAIEVSDGTHNFNGKITGKHISYEFVPGPFATLLANAYISKIKGEHTKHVLIIEELNRANAASVFGDVFQLLDRNKGVSNYFITIDNAFAKYLFDKVYHEVESFAPTEAAQLSIEAFKTIKLPENLYLWSTMNSADQGVFPLDSAFKRRWTFLYKDINAISPEDANRLAICLPDCSDPTNVHTQFYDWDTFRKAINAHILRVGFDEDRCVGYWFFSEEEVADIEAHTNCVIRAFYEDKDAIRELETIPNPFMDKLLSYLRQDVFRNVPAQFFKDDCKTLSAMRFATNYLEINGRKPVSIKEDITLLTDSAFEIIPKDSPISTESEEE